MQNKSDFFCLSSCGKTVDFLYENMILLEFKIVLLHRLRRLRPETPVSRRAVWKIKIMRKSVLFVILVCVAMVCMNTGCTDKKPQSADSLRADSFVADTIVDSDTVARIVEEMPMPKTADELFDDFFFNFINNKKLQRGRVMFPLPVRTGNHVAYTQRKNWQMEHFFRDQEYYTLILDNEKQMVLQKDTAVDNVVVEKIYIAQGMIEEFQFKRNNGKWALTEIRNVGLEESGNASFLLFLKNFFTDPESNEDCIADPLEYNGPDPEGEDETKYVNTTIPAENWSNYLPEIPNDVIYNILYGQKYSGGKEKIFMFKGIANGLETELIFKRHDDDWKLVKIKG